MVAKTSFVTFMADVIYGRSLLMMHSAYMLNRYGERMQPWRTPLSVENQSLSPTPLSTITLWLRYMDRISLMILVEELSPVISYAEHNRMLWNSWWSTVADGIADVANLKRHQGPDTLYRRPIQILMATATHRARCYVIEWNWPISIGQF